jgi:hypothetical protein
MDIFVWAFSSWYSCDVLIGLHSSSENDAQSISIIYRSRRFSTVSTRVYHLSLLNAAYTLNTYSKTSFNIIILHVTLSPKWQFLSKLSNWNCVLITHIAYSCSFYPSNVSKCTDYGAAHYVDLSAVLLRLFPYVKIFSSVPFPRCPSTCAV